MSDKINMMWFDNEHPVQVLRIDEQLGAKYASVLYLVKDRPHYRRRGERAYLNAARLTPMASHDAAIFKPIVKRRPGINRIRAEHKERAAEFAPLALASNASNENADCAVKAVAVCAGVNYAQAHAALKGRGRKDRQGTPTHLTIDAISSFGKRVLPVDPQRFIERYPGQHKGLRHVTTHHPDRFPAAWADGKTYLLATSDHILAVQNGRVIDWSRGRALRATRIYEVV